MRITNNKKVSVLILLTIIMVLSIITYIDTSENSTTHNTQPNDLQRSTNNENNFVSRNESSAYEYDKKENNEYDSKSKTENEQSRQSLVIEKSRTNQNNTINHYTYSSCRRSYIKFSPISDSLFVPEGGGIINILEFLDKKYGVRKWEYASDDLHLEIPIKPNNFSLIPISVGSEAISYVDVFATFTIFSSSDINILDADKYNKENMPEFYNINGSEEYYAIVRKTREFTYVSKYVSRISHFILGKDTYPNFKSRLNLSGLKNPQIFVVFKPIDEDETVKVLIQDKALSTVSYCGKSIYIKGEWPNGLKTDYYYE